MLRAAKKLFNNNLLYIFASILFISCTFYSHPSLALSADESKYTNGFKIYQYNMLPGESVADHPLPNAELGSFTATKSEYSYIEADKKVDVPVTMGRLYRAFGYLYVKQPGNYTIIVKAGGGRLKYGCIYANKNLALSALANPFVLTAPVKFSEPGIYPIDIRIYTNVNNKLVVDDGGYSTDDKFSFSIKTPESETPLPAHKVLLLPLR